MIYGSLCSGVGGFDLAMQSIGAKAVFYCEKDSYRQAVLQARMRDRRLDHAPIWPDLGTFNGLAWRGVVDCLVAGFPCQPHSLAGKRRGVADPRNLWPEVRRTIGKIQPRIVGLENVAGLAYPTGDQPPYALTVLGDLTVLGYDARWGIVSARDAGASHRRDRWWCFGVAHADGVGSPQQESQHQGMEWSEYCDRNGASPTLDDPNRGPGRDKDAARWQLPAWPDDPSETNGGGATVENPTVCDHRAEIQYQEDDRQNSRRPTGGLTRPSATLGNTDESGLEGWGITLRNGGDQWIAWPPGPTDTSPWERVLRERPDLAPAIGGKLNPAFVEWLQGFPIGWTDIPGATRRQRLEALGDAVVPAQAVLAWRLLRK